MSEKTDQQLIEEITGGKCFKLFDLDEVQVLVEWVYNTEDEAYELKASFSELMNARASMAFGGIKEIEPCLQAFMKFGRKEAEGLYKALIQKVDGNPMNVILGS